MIHLDHLRDLLEELLEFPPVDILLHEVIIHLIHQVVGDFRMRSRAIVFALPLLYRRLYLLPLLFLLLVVWFDAEQLVHGCRFVVVCIHQDFADGFGLVAGEDAAELLEYRLLLVGLLARCGHAVGRVLSVLGLLLLISPLFLALLLAFGLGTLLGVDLL